MRKSLLIIGLLGTAWAAEASVITFDDYSPIPDFPFPSVSSKGFNFTVDKDVIGVSNANPGPGRAFNGTPYLHFADFGGGSTLTMSRADGQVFDLQTVDLGLSWYLDPIADPTVQVDITGDLKGGGLFTASETVNYQFQTFTLNANVTALRFHFEPISPGYLSLDNFVIGDGQTVPEPSSAALVALLLGGLGAVRRRGSQAAPPAQR